jgi:hypothetical protein
MSRFASKISRIMKLWVGLAGALIVFVSTPAVAQADPRWGLLAEMAERDWIYGSFIAEAAVAARWEVPGQKLTFSQFGSMGSLVSSFELNPQTGQLTVRLFGPESPPAPLTAEPNGSISVEILGKKVPFARKEPDGNFWFRYTNGTKWVYRPLLTTHPKYPRLAKAIAEGRARAVDPSRLAGAASASVAVPQQQVAVPPVVQTFTPIVMNSGPRLALVIGNSAYAASMGQLPNPANDANAMAQALGALGFQVTLVKNADQKAMRRAISDFGQRLAKAGSGSTGLFFYAGHGIQAKGINYLIPTDANIQTQADVEMEAVGADAVLEQMEEARASTNIVILDACRNMPLVRGFRSPTRGLAPMDAPNGSFIAYSTAPGSVAADGLGANSPSVSALVKNLARRGESIESIFRDVRREVLTATEGTQTPWDSSSLIQPFYFAGR